MMMKWTWAGALRKYINLGGTPIYSDSATVLLMAGIFGLFAYLLVGYLYHQIAFSIAAALMAASVPFAVIAWKRGNRLAKFEERLLEALDLLGRAVRCRRSFPSTHRPRADRSGNERVGSLSNSLYSPFEEQNLGLPLRDSLLNLSERVLYCRR